MASRDYYDILGITKRASADELKSSYRKLARQYHPDINKAADAQKKFTEVQNAYDVLSDTKKRAVYDQFGPSAFESGSAEQAASKAAGQRGYGSGRGNPGGTYSWSNVGADRSGAASGGNGGGPGFGDFDPEDLGSIFESMFGGASGGGKAGGGKRKSTASKRPARGRATPSQSGVDDAGRGQQQSGDEAAAAELTLDFVAAAKGGKQRYAKRGGGGEGSIEVTIPPAIDDGTLLRARGGGADGEDLLFKVKITPHRFLRRGEYTELGRGLDLYVDLPISIAEATLGASVTVPTLEGKVDLQLPPGSPSGRKMRLRGLGLVDGQGATGDLYAVLRIVPPPSATMSDLEATLLREIASRGGAYRAW